MNKIFCLVLLLNSTAALAVDYRYCQEALLSTGEMNFPPFAIDAYGNLIVKKDRDKDKTYSFDGTKHTVKLKAEVFGEGKGSFVYEAYTTQGKPTRFTSTYQNNQSNLQRMKADMLLEVRNDVCFPKQLSTERDIATVVNGKGRTTKRSTSFWDLDMCDELKKFMDANPEVFACECGNEKVNNQLNAIIKKYDPSYKPDNSKGFLPGLFELETRDLAKKFSKPLFRSISSLEYCIFQPSFADHRIWPSGKTSAETAQDNKPTGSAQ